MRGWDVFSRHSYWIYRPVRNATGPVNLAAIMPDAHALAYFADIDNKQASVQTYISDMATKAMPDGLPGSKLIQHQRVAPGIWEATISLIEEDPTIINVLYQIFAYFGFGVVL